MCIDADDLHDLLHRYNFFLNSALDENGKLSFVLCVQVEHFNTLKDVYEYLINKWDYK